jgi:hypothetical protein
MTQIDIKNQANQGSRFEIADCIERKHTKEHLYYDMNTHWKLSKSGLKNCDCHLHQKKAYKGRSMVTGHDILKTKEIRAHEN